MPLGVLTAGPCLTMDVSADSARSNRHTPALANTSGPTKTRFRSPRDLTAAVDECLQSAVRRSLPADGRLPGPVEGGVDRRGQEVQAELISRIRCVGVKAKAV